METPRRNADSPGRASGARTLFEDELAANPVDQFSGWFAQAVEAGLPEPNAMVLATTSAEGHTRCRTVLLKAHDHAASCSTATGRPARAPTWPGIRGRACCFPGMASDVR